MVFRWSNEYSCNVKEIDCQHKKLFEICAELNDLISINDYCDKYDEIIKIFESLVEYTVYHFDTEEKLMIKTSYADYEVHKEEHDLFIEKLSTIDLSKAEIDQNELIKTLLTFVGKWIISHILNTDMKYMIHFEKYSLV